MNLDPMNPLAAVVSSVRRLQLDDGLIGFAGTVIFQFPDTGEATPRASVTVAVECPWTATYEDVERRLVDAAVGVVKGIADFSSVAEGADSTEGSDTSEENEDVEDDTASTASDLDNE